VLQRDSDLVPAVVHLRVLAPRDFILGRGPAMKPTVQCDQRQCLSDGVSSVNRVIAGISALAAFDRTLVLYPSA
jgi:hypothetical protein